MLGGRTLPWPFFVVEIAAQLARWTVIGVIFCRARLVIRLSSVQNVACQAVKHAILFTRATIVLSSSVRHVYMTGVVAPVMNVQRLYVRSVFTMGRSLLSRTARDVGAMFVEGRCRAVNVCDVL
jgi:hypothetical protein